MPPDPLDVLFLCTGNSARSIMAEAILNREGKGRFRAFSAGSHPTGGVNPFALHLLKLQGHDVSGLRSKSWDEFAKVPAPEFNFIFTVCDNAAGEACPVWPGQPVTAHWSIPDPAAVHGSDAESAAAFAEAYRMLRKRILAFIGLPLSSLDRLTLRNKLDAIGALGHGAGHEAGQ